MLLDILQSCADDAKNCKVGIILGRTEEVVKSTGDALGAFGVLPEFRIVESHSVGIAIPAWAGNRDFDVKAVKISLLGSDNAGTLNYYFCNLDDCWASLVLNVSKRLGSLCVIVRSSALEATPNDYVQELTVMKSGARVRVLRVGFDDGWQFSNSGIPFPFEDTVRYTRKRIKDRLSRGYISGLVDQIFQSYSVGGPPFVSFHFHRQ